VSATSVSDVRKLFPFALVERRARGFLAHRRRREIPLSFHADVPISLYTSGVGWTMSGPDESRRALYPLCLDVFKEKLTFAINHESVPVEFLTNILEDVRFQEQLNPEWRTHREFLEELQKNCDGSI
jgi:hypothetical protein